MALRVLLRVLFHALLLWRAGALSLGEVVGYMLLFNAFRFTTFISIFSFNLFQMGLSSAADHPEDSEVTGDGASFPPTASMCHKCSTKALVLMDGCATCLNCGYSKCG